MKRAEGDPERGVESRLGEGRYADYVHVSRAPSRRSNLAAAACRSEGDGLRGGVAFEVVADRDAAAGGEEVKAHARRELDDAREVRAAMADRQRAAEASAAVLELAGAQRRRGRAAAAAALSSRQTAREEEGAAPRRSRGRRSRRTASAKAQLLQMLLQRAEDDAAADDDARAGGADDATAAARRRAGPRLALPAHTRTRGGVAPN